MQTLVLGATGFIGSNVARALVAHGHCVRVLRRSHSSTLALDGVDVQYVLGDVSDTASLVAAMQDVQAVFHVAGYYPPNSLNPQKALRMAVAGMRAVLQAARAVHVQHLIYTSSLSTIGIPTDGRTLADEHDYYLPGSVNNPYFEAKWAMECEAYRAALMGQRVVILCPTIVFGPGDVKPTSGSAVIALARGMLPAYIDGKTNAIDVRAVAEAHIAALEQGQSGERYILGGRNTTVLALTQTAAQLLGVRLPRRQVPASLAMLVGRASEVAMQALPKKPLFPLTEAIEMIRHGQHYDINKARSELGLVVRPIDEALRDGVAWFRKYGYLDTPQTATV